MTSLFRLLAVARFAVAAFVFTTLCAGGVVGQSVTKDLGGAALASTDAGNAVPKRLNVADKDAGGPELVHSA